MEVIYSKHAIDNMIERKISRPEVVETLSSPEKLLESKKGRKIAQKTIGDRLLRVIFKTSGKVYIIVTVYYTRIGRY